MTAQQAAQAMRTLAYVKSINPQTYRQEYNQGHIESIDGDTLTIRWILPWECMADGDLNQHHISEIVLA